jgi:hypothetical protein
MKLNLWLAALLGVLLTGAEGRSDVILPTTYDMLVGKTTSVGMLQFSGFSKLDGDFDAKNITVSAISDKNGVGLKFTFDPPLTVSGPPAASKKLSFSYDVTSTGPNIAMATLTFPLGGAVGAAGSADVTKMLSVAPTLEAFVRVDAMDPTKVEMQREKSEALPDNTKTLKVTDTLTVSASDTAMGSTGKIEEVTDQFTLVPEPASWMLLVSGAVLVLATRRGCPTPSTGRASAHSAPRKGHG